METTRHFTSTIYIVNDGAAALHYHPKLELHVPPGGHVDRDELPHEAGLREIQEETGLEPSLIDDTEPVGAPTGQTLPRPRELLLYDIDADEDGVYHQHIDHIYFATVPSRGIDPEPGEAGVDAWAWYDRDDLSAADIDADTAALALRAIEAAENADR